MLQEILAQFFKAMMKSEATIISSPSTKNTTSLSHYVGGGIWDWIVNVIQSNKPRTQLHYQLQQLNPFFQSTTCSDAFALNLSYVMLLLCKPFLEKNESQSSIQLEMLWDSQMLGIDLTTETKLAPSNVVPQSTSASPSSSPVTSTTSSLPSVTSPPDDILHLSRVDTCSDGSCTTTCNDSNNVSSQSGDQFSQNLSEANSQSYQTAQLSLEMQSESRHPSLVSHFLPRNSKKGVFVSRVFFLTHAVFHVCTIPTIESYARFNQQLARLRERSNLLQHSLQSLTNPLQHQVIFPFFLSLLSINTLSPVILHSQAFCSHFYFFWCLRRF
jgi:hypothetical protein